MNFYGIEDLVPQFNEQSLRKISVGYHGAVKRTCGLNKWDSIHVACETIGLDIFKHLHARTLISYMYAMLSCRSSCLVRLRNLFRFMSQISDNFERFSSDIYQLVSVYTKPLCAVIATLQFIQRNQHKLSGWRNIYSPNV